MTVCMYIVYIYVMCIYGCIYSFIYLSVPVCMHVYMYVGMCGFAYVCMYFACTYICI